jgi:ubiquinone biosynthesis accessory factor UbiK
MLPSGVGGLILPNTPSISCANLFFVIFQTFDGHSFEERTSKVRGERRFARMWCARGDTFPYMVDKRLSEELSERIGEALRNSPALDVERNLRALLAAWLDRLDVVLREDFEVQRKLLERAQAKLADLERRIAELESRGHSQRLR